jgi:hypothetical protein
MGPYELLAKVVAIFEQLGIPYLVTGSIAAMACGEPRLTNDIDLVAGLRESHVDGLLQAFPPEEYYISEDSIRQAIHLGTQFNIIHPASGLKVDVIINRNTPFDRSRFSRIHRLHPAEEYEANFAAPEDVIIKKMEYYRAGGSDKHLRDITGIIKIAGESLDKKYISDWADELELKEIWAAILQRMQD